MQKFRKLAGMLLVGALVVPLATTAAPLVAVNPPAPMPAGGWAPLDPTTQPKFTYDLPVPIFYTPDTSTYPGYDYYEIEAAPVEQLSVAFPTPPGGVASVPAGYQWLGLVDPATKAPLFTNLWGYAQVNQGGGAIGGLMGHPVATYPSMSFRATKGRPVKVKWINNTTDWNPVCPRPGDATQPCGIDRTLMGVQGPYDPVKFGGTQQPDNAMVVHLHGGEIPPDSDGFAELWFGNTATSAAWPATAFPTKPVANSLDVTVTQNIDPVFDTSLAPPNGVTLGAITRPVGNSMIYNYPMVQDAATIWYHDHALGKTRVNVVAGPAGYFWIDDPVREPTLGLPNTGDCTNGGILAGNCYDIPIVVQDRAFNANGGINFPNGLGQNVLLNPLVAGAADSTGFVAHPQWVPEYFGDHAVVNGAIWPKFKVEPRPYRFRFLDGSNARCYTFGLKVPGFAVGPAFYTIGSDQGYMPTAAKTSRFTMCPGERYDVVIDFSAFKGRSVYLTNTAGAPYPNGPTPQDPIAAGGFPSLANIMRFDVGLTANAAYATTWSPAGFSGGPVASATLPTTGPGVVERELVLNEHLDDLGNPLAVQIDGKAFEAPVTETPSRGGVEVWKIINTTVDAHPMHLHLVQFKVVSRQPFNVLGYRNAIATKTGIDKTLSSVTPFLYGTPRGPDANEAGWKDTAKSIPGEVLTVVARWDGRWADCANGTPQGPGATLCTPAVAAPGAGVPLAQSDFWQPVTGGPYVWHCHIVDHEDNEMMRPSLVIPVTL